MTRMLCEPSGCFKPGLEWPGLNRLRLPRDGPLVVRMAARRLIGECGRGILVEGITRTGAGRADTESKHCWIVLKPQPLIPEMLVRQYSPATAAVGVATRARIRTPTPAAISLRTNFILLSFQGKQRG